MLEDKLEKIKKSIIQGGMGVGVSNWKLAKTTSQLGCLGVVSGTALEATFTRRLQLGDLDGSLRFAMSYFPNQSIVDEVMNKYYIEDGKDPDKDFTLVPLPRVKKISEKIVALNSKELQQLSILANFSEVFLAKHDHEGPVGINYLYKIQWNLMPSIYGAMMADVDSLLIGAGIARDIPGVLDSFLEDRPGEIGLVSENSKGDIIQFDPSGIVSMDNLDRPAFLGIVSTELGVRGLPNADGYIFERHIAGGHNAPPRNKELKDGELQYGAKDELNLDKLNNMLDKKEIRPPYWFAGGFASKLKEAQEQGAVGIQVGSVFAYSKDSGIEDKLRKRAVDYIMNGGEVIDSPVASPSGYPFKVLGLEGTLGEEAVYDGRERRCSLKYLVDFFEKDGRLVTRCPAEPVEVYTTENEGDIENTLKKACLCNGLLTTIGYGSPGEPPILTSGSNLEDVKNLVRKHGVDYDAENVVDHINS